VKQVWDISKGLTHPTIALVGGYTALDLSNVITVQNAMNGGVAAWFKHALKTFGENCWK
jgi:hypothetical protein